MKRFTIGLLACGGLAVTAAAFAQDGRMGQGGPFRGRGGQMSPGDREAFAEARIAALKAGLKLTPDQEKLWPPVEEAMRGLARQRAEARSARRERWASMREGGGQVDIPDQLRFMADRQAALADALRKLADASGPLYKSLDEGQRRRMRILARVMGRQPGMGRGGMGAGGPGMGRGGRWRDGMMRRGGPDDQRDFADRDGGTPPR